MARKVTIPITDHNDVDVCTTSYVVEYRITGETYWNKQTFSEPPLVLSNLDDDFEYQFAITRYCCDGVASDPLELTINTTILPAPSGFVATPGDLEVSLDWSAVTDADGYVVERAEDSTFTINYTPLYTGSIVGYTDTDVSNDVTYYYRLKATATNHADGAYATANATPTSS